MFFESISIKQKLKPTKVKAVHCSPSVLTADGNSVMFTISLELIITSKWNSNYRVLLAANLSIFFKNLALGWELAVVYTSSRASARRVRFCRRDFSWRTLHGETETSIQLRCTKIAEDAHASKRPVTVSWVVDGMWNWRTNGYVGIAGSTMLRGAARRGAQVAAV